MNNNPQFYSVTRSASETLSYTISKDRSSPCVLTFVSLVWFDLSFVLRPFDTF